MLCVLEAKDVDSTGECTVCEEAKITEDKGELARESWMASKGRTDVKIEDAVKAEARRQRMMHMSVIPPWRVPSVSICVFV